MNFHFLPRDLPARRVVACLGLIADTHLPARCDELPAAVFDVLRGADLVLHAGDMGDLAVMDRLGDIALVAAVHGNDESDEAQRVLPYQHLLALAGRRLLLCHSHLPDAAAERASRVGDAWGPKLAQRAEQARHVGASIMVLGHLHIPFVVEYQGVWLINPGAIASPNSLSRQVHQTVALLYLRDDGRPFVVHIDLARPDQPHTPAVDWTAGFAAALGRYSASILSPELAHLAEAIGGYRLRHDSRLWSAVSRAARPCWRGQKATLTAADLIASVTEDAAFSARERDELLALVEGVARAGSGRA